MVMKLKLILIQFIFVGASFSTNAQTLVSKQFLKTYPKSYFISQLGVLFANTDVDCYKITYTTINPEGELDTASGFISLPIDETKTYPIAAYHHGTVGSRLEVPSNLSYEHVLPAALSSVGFISISPDYIGLGTSRGEHPYIHAASEASASKDMLSATLEFLMSEKYKTNKNLYITGYSQGGHAGMALHRLLETSGTSFHLKAAAHLSGPYDISTSMTNLLLGEEEYAFVAYAANVALSFNRIYGIFPNDLASDLFIEPYASEIEKFRREEIDLWALNEFMLNELKKNNGRAQPKRMIIPSLVTEITTNPNHPIRLALIDNDVYDWKPGIPTRLLYCKADDQVSYKNSLVAEAKMKLNGSTSVTAQDVGPTLDHSGCVQPAVTNTLLFFYSNSLTTSQDNLIETIDVYPNPTSNFVMLSFDAKQAIAVDVLGRNLKLDINNNEVDVSNLENGYYFLLMEKENNEWVMAKILKVN